MPGVAAPPRLTRRPAGRDQNGDFGAGISIDVEQIEGKFLTV